jgi:hypothetical protein
MDFFHALGREAASLWDQITVWLISVFDPQAGWQPKAIFGGILLFIVFWISKRGTKN